MWIQSFVDTELADSAGHFDHTVLVEDILRTGQFALEGEPTIDNCSAGYIAIAGHTMDSYCKSGTAAAPSVDTILVLIEADMEAVKTGHSIDQDMAEEDDTS